MTTWRKQLSGELERNNESWSDVVSHTLTDEELDREFDDGYGAAEGSPFTLWTAKRVYFPAEYDGAESVASVPRHPCKEKTGHV